eukprot:Platyproteum_vivax@DN4273_c0_g1_i1.p1
MLPLIRMSALKSRVRCFSTFHQIYQNNHIPTTPLNKLCVAGRSIATLISNARRGDCVASLNDVTGREALIGMYNEMLKDEEGKQVLQERPLLDSKSLDPTKLAAMPEGSVGREYLNFMNTYGYEAEGRSATKYVDNEVLAYIMTRYRQLHDFNHTIYGLNVTVESELVLKVLEFNETKLPAAALSSTFGFLSLPVFDPAMPPLTHHRFFFTQLLPWAVKASRGAKRPLYMIYIEKWLERPLSDLQEACGVLLPPQHVLTSYNEN